MEYTIRYYDSEDMLEDVSDPYDSEKDALAEAKAYAETAYPHYAEVWANGLVKTVKGVVSVKVS